MSSNKQNTDQQQKAFFTVVEGLSTQVQALQQQMSQMAQMTQMSMMKQQQQPAWPVGFYSPVQIQAAQMAQMAQMAQLAMMARSSVENIHQLESVELPVGTPVEDEPRPKKSGSAWPAPVAAPAPKLDEREFPEVSSDASKTKARKTLTTSWADKVDKHEAKEAAKAAAAAVSTTTTTKHVVQVLPAPKPPVPVPVPVAVPVAAPVQTSSNTIPTTDFCSHRPITEALVLAGLMQKLEEEDVEQIRFMGYTLKFKCKECQDKAGHGIVFLNVTFIGRCFETGRIHLFYKKSTKMTAREQTLDFTSTFIEGQYISRAKALMHLDGGAAARDNETFGDDEERPMRFTPPTLGTYMVDKNRNGSRVEPQKKKPTGSYFSEENFGETD